jgi:hypothetical protein
MNLFAVSAAFFATSAFLRCFTLFRKNKILKRRERGDRAEDAKKIIGFYISALSTLDEPFLATHNYNFPPLQQLPDSPIR